MIIINENQLPVSMTMRPEVKGFSLTGVSPALFRHMVEKSFTSGKLRLDTLKSIFLGEWVR